MTLAAPTGSVTPSQFGMRVKKVSSSLDTMFTVMIPCFSQPDWADDSTRLNKQRYKVWWNAKNSTGTKANIRIVANRATGAEGTNLSGGDNRDYITTELTTTSTSNLWRSEIETEYPRTISKLDTEDRSSREDRSKRFGWMRLMCKCVVKDDTDVFDVYGIHIEMINDKEPLDDTFSQEIFDGATADTAYYKNKPVSSYMMMHMQQMLQLYAGEGRMYWTLPLLNEVV
jgi:hypothetical protein